MSKTREYKIYKGIKNRCYNTRTKGYADYGGRGIRMSTAWLNSFEAFYSDMGPRPTSKHTVERVNNDGNYCAENCVWIPKSMQSKNTRQNVVMNLRGVSIIQADLARLLGIPRETIAMHRRLGRSADDIVKIYSTSTTELDNPLLTTKLPMIQCI